MNPAEPLRQLIEETFGELQRALDSFRPDITIEETGTVRSISKGLAVVKGLRGTGADEILLFPGGISGVATDLREDSIGVILLEHGEGIEAGMRVRRTGRVMDTPVGEGLIGRVVSPSGSPLDGRGEVKAYERRPMEREAPSIMDRDPVTVPLQTGLKIIDSLIPIGRGQRELILGDRQTGKTAVALDTILNQKGRDVICIYCAIGQRGSAVAGVVEELRERGAMEHTIVVVASGEDPPGLQFVAPYAATTMGEYFMEKGRDVLVVYDDLTRHARAYRELSLLMRRPPGREAYPGDIFYIHSRLLERSTRLRKELGGGSLTALPIIETQAQNLSAYIPTNLISITDGQIYLSPDLFSKGVLPAVELSRSVSRVGGKTQLPAYRAVTGDLRLSYSQFHELESFARFGTRLDDATRRALDRGHRVREMLKQNQYDPWEAGEQIVAFLALNEGKFDSVAPETLARVAGMLQIAVRKAMERESETSSILRRISLGEKLPEEDRVALLKFAAEILEQAEEEADKEIKTEEAAKNSKPAEEKKGT